MVVRTPQWDKASLLLKMVLRPAHLRRLDIAPSAPMLQISDGLMVAASCRETALQTYFHFVWQFLLLLLDLNSILIYIYFAEFYYFSNSIL